MGRTRAAGIATVTTAVGWAATAAMCLAGIYLSVAADAPDRAAQIQIQENFNEAAGSSLVFLMCVVGAVGYLIMAFSLARAAIISKGAAALIAIGGVTTLLTMVGPVTVVLVVSALLLTAGHALALRAEL